MGRLDRWKRRENGPAVPEGRERVGERNGVGTQGRREKRGASIVWLPRPDEWRFYIKGESVYESRESNNECAGI
jgi:hypothetical protein